MGIVQIERVKANKTVNIQIGHFGIVNMSTVDISFVYLLIVIANVVNLLLM